EAVHGQTTGTVKRTETQARINALNVPHSEESRALILKIDAELEKARATPPDMITRVKHQEKTDQLNREHSEQLVSLREKIDQLENDGFNQANTIASLNRKLADEKTVAQSRLELANQKKLDAATAEKARLTAAAENAGLRQAKDELTAQLKEVG